MPFHLLLLSLLLPLLLLLSVSLSLLHSNILLIIPQNPLPSLPKPLTKQVFHQHKTCRILNSPAANSTKAYLSSSSINPHAPPPTLSSLISYHFPILILWAGPVTESFRIPLRASVFRETRRQIENPGAQNSFFRLSLHLLFAQEKVEKWRSRYIHFTREHVSIRAADPIRRFPPDRLPILWCRPDFLLSYSGNGNESGRMFIQTRRVERISGERPFALFARFRCAPVCLIETALPFYGTEVSDVRLLSNQALAHWSFLELNKSSFTPCRIFAFK